MGPLALVVLVSTNVLATDYLISLRCLSQKKYQLLFYYDANAQFFFKAEIVYLYLHVIYAYM